MKQRCSREVTTMTRVCCAHHIFSIEHLLGQLWHRKSTILLRTARRKWSEACHEEVEPREGYEINRDFAQIAIELPREAQTRGNTTHGCTHQMIQITIGGCRKFQCAKADVIQS